MTGPPDLVTRRDYIERILQLYRRLPGTLGTVRPTDRRLARQLYDERIPLAVVEAAFTLATCRRIFRPRPTLPPIRTLHYLLPVIRELQREPIDPAYEAHLKGKLARLPSA